MTYIYEGLGFPIFLENIKFYSFDGYSIPYVDVRGIAAEAYDTLVIRIGPMTEAEMKFMQTYKPSQWRNYV